jgi:hypothetical protein
MNRKREQDRYFMKDEEIVRMEFRFLLSHATQNQSQHKNTA